MISYFSAGVCFAMAFAVYFIVGHFTWAVGLNLGLSAINLYIGSLS